MNAWLCRPHVVSYSTRRTRLCALWEVTFAESETDFAFHRASWISDLGCDENEKRAPNVVWDPNNDVCTRDKINQTNDVDYVVRNMKKQEVTS